MTTAINDHWACSKCNIYFLSFCELFFWINSLLAAASSVHHLHKTLKMGARLVCFNHIYIFNHTYYYDHPIRFVHYCNFIKMTEKFRGSHQVTFSLRSFLLDLLWTLMDCVFSATRYKQIVGVLWHDYSNCILSRQKLSIKWIPHRVECPVLDLILSWPAPSWSSIGWQKLVWAGLTKANSNVRTVRGPFSTLFRAGANRWMEERGADVPITFLTYNRAIGRPIPWLHLQLLFSWAFSFILLDTYTNIRSATCQKSWGCLHWGLSTDDWGLRIKDWDLGLRIKDWGLRVVSFSSLRPHKFSQIASLSQLVPARAWFKKSISVTAVFY